MQTQQVKLIKVDGDKILIQKKTIPHLALEGALYPFKILPGDLLNGAVELLGKNTCVKKMGSQHFRKNLYSKISDNVLKLMQKLTL